MKQILILEDNSESIEDNKKCYIKPRMDILLFKDILFGALGSIPESHSGTSFIS